MLIWHFSTNCVLNLCLSFFLEFAFSTSTKEHRSHDSKLVSAVDAVVKSIPSDQQKTRSDLLRKLEEHSSSHIKSQDDCDVR